ncbi:hypothetical protein CRENBAI_021052 [Crenichthys baileyi]|uniref:Uncharacterized protein n=1 Tax=Crenichthys baileyi TaxID=28760 RepID=A0AAV9SAA6_9TELE
MRSAHRELRLLPEAAGVSERTETLSIPGAQRDSRGVASSFVFTCSVFSGRTFWAWKWFLKDCQQQSLEP